MFKLFLALGLTVFAHTARADWASGGGELIQDSQNPWFIQNTKTVKYCTQYDPQHYAQTPEVTEELIEKAFAFWREEFRKGQSIFEPRIEVATQNFIKTSCPNGRQDVDMVFQFGFLDSEQIAFIKTPKRFAGLAVRTDYDPVNLRGRGFIYIAADSGPLKFEGRNTVHSPWTLNEGGLLYWTLVHELGHVFGLTHSKQRSALQNFSEINVMASEFIESVMSRGTAPLFTRELVVNPIFKVEFRATDRPAWHCGGYGNGLLREFFGVGRNWNCFGIKIMAEDLAVFVSNNPSDASDDVLLGRAVPNEKRKLNQSFTLVDEAVHFWLPPEQIVIPIGTRFTVPSYYVEEGVATYQNLFDHSTRQMSYSIDPRKTSPLRDDLKIGGILNGKLYISLIEGI